MGMQKVKIDKLAGLSPVGKEIVLKAEKDKAVADGAPNEKELVDINLRIYPLTVEERTEIMQLTKAAQAEVDQNKKNKLLEEIGKKTIVYTLKKSIEGFSEENFSSIPNDWHELITAKLFEFDGLDYKKLKGEGLKKLIAPSDKQQT